MSSSRPPFVVWLLLLTPSSCGTSDSTRHHVDAGSQHGTGDAGTRSDAGESLPDGGPCTPGAASLLCANATTLSLCTDDPDFDGNSDGPARTVTISCKSFFRDVGEASCEPFDTTTTEALCTMDNGGPCGVITVTGAFTTARCTVDDAVCILDLDFDNGDGVSKGNYVCSPSQGIGCSPAGDAFVPFCSGDKLVWRCTDDGDGTPLPRVDDCAALGGGTCNAAENKCTDIALGGRCNLTEWICGSGLACENNVCVAQ